MSTPITLDAAQLASYTNEGFLVVENLLTSAEIDSFLAWQKGRPADYEPGLRSHTTDPNWEYIAKHPNVAGIVAQIMGGTPHILQTMFLPKYAGQSKEDNAGIALHQDTHYLPTEPNTLTACWVAMSDTSGENGGLCVIPGSHKHPLHSTEQSASDDHISWRMNYDMRDRDGKEWVQEFYSFEIGGIDPDTINRLNVPKGSGVFFTGMTIHGSYANVSPTKDRLAFATHYIKDGTWCIRADVQNTVAVTEYSAPKAG